MKWNKYLLLAPLFYFLLSGSPAFSAEKKDKSQAVSAGMVYVQKGDGGFYMDKYLVTQEAYHRVIGSNPSNFEDCPTCPIEQVNWDEATNYCRKVGKVLPKEKDWEYAASEGGKNTWSGTSNASELGDFAWFDENSGSKTHPVGTKKPNGLGLYDMSGNVWEWMDDWYDSSQKTRVARGGPWGEGAANLRAVNRGYLKPDLRYDDYGFRCSKY
jgi:sulfatase modifying factor 1